MADSLKPILLGYTAYDVWAIVHPVSYIGWGLILSAPFWRPALKWALLPPLFHAVLFFFLFAKVLIPLMTDPDSPPPNLNDMSTLQVHFHDPAKFLCAWIHYLAFDQLVGLTMAHDALTTLQVSKLVFYSVVTVCLFFTFLFGPVGFLLYMMAQTVLITSELSTSTSKKLD